MKLSTKNDRLKSIIIETSSHYNRSKMQKNDAQLRIVECCSERSWKHVFKDPFHSELLSKG